MTKPRWFGHLAKTEFKKGTVTMKKSNTALEIPGWYVEFQAAVLRQLPRPGQIDQFTAEGWTDNQKSLKKNLSECLVPPPVKKIIKIDRSKPFDLKIFLSENCWSVEQEDSRALALTEFDLMKVQFKDMLNDSEPVDGEEKQERLKKAGYICLDAKVFQTLWENKELIPSSWKEKINGEIRYICFDGTILRESVNNSGRVVLLLYWQFGNWNWCFRWLHQSFDIDNPSAVLVS